MKKALQKSWRDFVSLLYPNLCVACREKQPIQKHILCVRCIGNLIPTSHHEEAENAFTERFWGRIPLQSGAAMFPFVKGGYTQNLIHALKYGGIFDVGIRIGQWYGLKLKKSPLFNTVELIVPVPIHPKKKHTRGYNQSDAFAQGLAETMQIPWIPNGLKRTVFSESQTKKSKEERLINVLEAFEVDAAAKLKGKHILLVDDVLTTGATLEACALKILKIPDTKISMATIAIAK